MRFSTALGAAFLGAILVSSPAPADNGEITPGAIRQHLLDTQTFAPDALPAADANDDGAIDAADVIRLQNIEGRTITLPGEVEMVLVPIPPGTFTMGSPPDERSRSVFEGPQRQVTVGTFYMAKYPVTQAQWLAVMEFWPGQEPTGFNGLGDNVPAYHISWVDAQNFIDALNNHIQQTEQGPLTVRLPSEAEWEYAARAGTQTRFYFGDSLGVDDHCGDDGLRTQHMWYCADLLPEGATPVGLRLPNPFGLHDIHGSIWEWCEDDFHDSYTGAPVDGSPWVDEPRQGARVRRGGSWASDARFCRSAARESSLLVERQPRVGFRIAAD